MTQQQSADEPSTSKEIESMDCTGHMNLKVNIASNYTSEFPKKHIDMDDDNQRISTELKEKEASQD